MACSASAGRNPPSTRLLSAPSLWPFSPSLELVREFSHLAQDQIPYLGNYFTWITAGSFRVDFSLQVDQLTIVMLLTVSFVGMLIHIYSTGYMAHEGGYYRFFCYLNLFMFFMLTLVMAANLVVMFVGWEGVGLCSYLLIGFWFLKKSAADAGKKAFIVTRIGDLGFMVGVLLVFWTFNSENFADIFQQAGHMASPKAPPTLAFSPRFVFCFLPELSESPRNCLCTFGSRTRWKAPRPSAR